MTYTEFCTLLSADPGERFMLMLEYEDFEVWFDTNTNVYYYVECGENNASDLYEVTCVASLKYDVNRYLKINKNDAGNILHELFDCDCCGEYVGDDAIYYLWFKRIEESGQ